MFSFSLPVSLALAHRKERITTLPFPISIRGGSQSDLERSWGSGGLSSDPEMSVIHSFIPLCLFRAPSACFTWWHCKEVARRLLHGRAHGWVQFAFDTCLVLCVHLSGKEKIWRLFLKAQDKSEWGQRRVPSRSPAEADVLAWTAAAAWCWREPLLPGTGMAPLRLPSGDGISTVWTMPRRELCISYWLGCRDAVRRALGVPTMKWGIIICLGPAASVVLDCTFISTWSCGFLVGGKAQAQLVMLYS